MDAARKKAIELLAKVDREVEKLRKGQCDPDTVHDVRVAVRRLEQCLEVWEPCFKRKPLRPLRKQVKAIRKAAGNVRDLDIAADLFREAGIRRPVFLSRSRNEAAKTLLSVAKEWIEQDDPIRVRNKVSVPSQELAQNFSRRLMRQYRVAGKAAASKLTGADNEALHRFRIITKKLRYSLELVETEPLEHLQQIQTILGDLNDCHALIQLLDGRVPRMAQFLEKRATAKLLEFQQYWRNNMTIKRKTT